MVPALGHLGEQVTSVPYQGVAYTIDTMRTMVRDALLREQSMPLLRLRDEILAQVRPKDYRSEIAAIYYWCMVNIAYRRDPVHVEKVQNPLVVLSKTPADAAAGRRARQEDCESICNAIAALVMSAGTPCSYITIATTPPPKKGQKPAHHHVFTVARLPNGIGPDKKPQTLRLVLDPVAGPAVSSMLARTTDWKEWLIEPVRFQGRPGWGVAGMESASGYGTPPVDEVFA